MNDVIWVISWITFSTFCTTGYLTNNIVIQSIMYSEWTIVAYDCSCICCISLCTLHSISYSRNITSSCIIEARNLFKYSASYDVLCILHYIIQYILNIAFCIIWFKWSMYFRCVRFQGHTVYDHVWSIFFCGFDKPVVRFGWLQD